MLRTNIVLETQPGRSRSVAEMIGQLHGMESILVDGDHRVTATWNVPEGQNPEPEGFQEVLRAMSHEILEVALVEERH
jgi:hypothetical protein